LLLLVKVDINKEKLDAIAKEGKDAGANVLPLVFDLSVLENNEAAVAKTAQHFGSKQAASITANLS